MLEYDKYAMVAYCSTVLYYMFHSLSTAAGHKSKLAQGLSHPERPWGWDPMLRLINDLQAAHTTFPAAASSSHLACQGLPRS